MGGHRGERFDGGFCIVAEARTSNAGQNLRPVHRERVARSLNNPVFYVLLPVLRSLLSSPLYCRGGGSDNDNGT